MTGSAPVWGIVDARPLTETPLQHHVVWVGERAARTYAVLTSPLGPVVGRISDRELWLHWFLGCIQRCYASEEFVELLGTTPRELDLVFDDLAGSAFDDDVLDVDGVEVPGRAVTYRGVRFAAPTDPRGWPFVLARGVETPGSWPPVRLVSPQEPGRLVD